MTNTTSNTKSLIISAIIYAMLVQMLFLPLPAKARANNPAQTQPAIPAVITNRKPTLNSGNIVGSLRLQSGENFSINSGITMSEIFLPGTPLFTFNGGTHGGIVNDGGAATPTGYRMTMNGGTITGKIHRQSDPVAFPADIPASVPNQSGTRSVSINTPADVAAIGNWQTLANLTVNVSNLTINVPPGNYRSITLNANSLLRFSSGTYNFSNTLTLNNNSRIESTGATEINLRQSINLNAGKFLLGANTLPADVKLNILGTTANVNANCEINASVRVPNGTLTMNSSTAAVRGIVWANYFTLNGGTVTGETCASNGSGCAAVPSLEAVNPNRGLQGQTVQITLTGRNTNWVAGQTRASFGGEISVGNASEGDFGLLNVTDATTATADLVINPKAALAPRTVRVVTQLPNGQTEEVLLNDVFTVAPVSPPGSAQNTVTTFAGSAGQSGFADGVGTTARFRDLAGIAVGTDDAVYIADAGNHRIRVARQQTNGNWNVQTIAGNGTGGYQDGVGTAARFNNPQGIAVTPDGSLYVADAGNNRIRKILTDGTVSTIAGDGTAGFIDGNGSAARFNNPKGIAVDTAGNIYIADTGNFAVRKIDTNGNVVTLAGDGTVGANDSPNARFNGLAGITVDGDDVYIYIADGENHLIRRLDSSGMVMTIAGTSRGFADGSAADARFANPTGIAVDGAGRIVVADTVNSLIRSVSPTLATNGSPLAVSTIAGAGEYGASDGAGNTAKFKLPRGVAVSRSSAIFVADAGNNTLRRIGLPPQILSFSPASGKIADTITIYGENFDGRGIDKNTVTFAKTGGGTVSATIMYASRSQLSVIVPAQAVTGKIIVTTADGTAESATDFEVENTPPPAITDFTPRRGQIGAAVKLIGTSLKPATSNPIVTFAGANNTRLNALINSATNTEVNVLVPNGAVSGFIDLTTAWGSAQTPQEFIVDETQEFQITLSPATVQAVERSQGTAIVYLNSSTSTFTQLANLSTTNLPNGVTASFEPENITAGAHSTLKLNLANAAISSGGFSFTVRAKAVIDGREVIREAPATLSVLTAGQTTLSGRVLNTDSEPVIGATVSLDGQSTTTDSAGSFTLSGITAGQARPLQIDGRTASAPNRTYPVITEPANIVAGQANQIPYIFYLPPIDTQYEVAVVPGQTTVAINPRIEGLQMTIPPNANLRNRDGSPVTRVSITPLAIDRTPTPLPPNVRTGLVYTSQPGGALTDVPIPVIYPNLLGEEPNTQVELYAFNHDTVQWYIYGYGRVSADGKTIAPEINPNTGQLYGLQDFSWHFPSPPNAGPNGDPSGGGGRGGKGKGKGGGRGDGSGDDDCDDSNEGENPVNYSTGMKVEESTDIYIEGNRGSLEVTRYYTSDLVLNCPNCMFGNGVNSNYSYRLNGNFQVGGAGRIVNPDESTGQLLSYSRTDADGSLVFTTRNKLVLLGDELRKLSNGTFVYRYASGDKMEFDSQGRFTAEVDLNGNRITLSYSGNRLIQVTDPVGRSLNFQYNSNGYVSQVTDPINRTWRYGYSANLLTSVTDPLGNVVRYGHDFTGRIISITDPKGNIAKQVIFDGQGRVLSQRFADGGIESYEYFLTGGIVTQTTITDPMGRKTIKRFNSSGYTIENTDSLGQVARIDRNLNNNLALSTSGSCGCQEKTRQYDARGNIVAESDREGRTSQMEYVSGTNYVNKITDPNGQTYNLTYDSNGNATSFVGPGGQSSNLTFDSYGQITAITDILGNTTQMEYDAQGNMTASVDALGHRTTLEYDAIGRRTAIIDPLGRREEVTYDAIDRITSFKDSNGAVTLYEYDANDNLTKVTDALGRVWRTNYDAKNRIAFTFDPLNRRIRYQYNQGDEVTTITTPENRVVKYDYNNRGELTKITEPNNQAVNYAYDYKGNVLSVSDQRGNVTSYVYDTLFRPIKRINPLGQTASVTYNQNDQISEATDELGRRRTTAYNIEGRPTTTTFADSQVSYQYDALGRMTQITDTQGGSVSRAYDAAGRVTSETTPNGQVTYTYNAANERTSMTAGNRASVFYEYDAAGRLAQIRQGAEQFDYSYDLLSRMNGLTRPNSVTTTYDYDTVGRLSRLKHTGTANQVIEDYQYSYTSDDQIAGITSLLPANNLPDSKNYGAADPANRIKQIGNATYTFDELGQISSKQTAQGTTRYNWDARGRLRGAVLPDGQSVGYDYDAIGRLSKRTVGTQQTSYLYDGLDVVSDQNNDGSTVEYLNGRSIDDKLRQSTAATGSLYFQTDHLGSTTALTNSAGNVVERQSYTPFGETTGSNLTRYGFTGREKDNLTGLMHYRARWYDAEQGRFISEDPIGFEGGMNFYAYAGNSPTNFIDPMGTSITSFTKGLVYGAGWSIVLAIAGGAISALVSCLTGGAAVPPLVAAIVAIAGGAAVAAAIYQTAMELAEIIVDMLQGSDCPDKLHYRIGYLIGSFIGDIIGGAVAKNFKFCFVAGTLVHTKDGLKKIEDIKVGDEVLSYNEQTGQNEYQFVVNTFINQVEESLSIKVTGENDEIGVSFGHPFFVKIRQPRSDLSDEEEERGTWLSSEDLQVGDLIRLASGRWAEVESISENTEAESVYNFEVANNHNYFVGEQGLLVHNTGPNRFCGPRRNHLKKDGTPSFDKNREEVLRGDPDCVWCGLKAERNGNSGHADHMTPRSKGGGDEVTNLEAACLHCNTSRGNRDTPKTLPKDYPSNMPLPPWYTPPQKK